jgi:flagellar biogenesis protein FliO
MTNDDSSISINKNFMLLFIIIFIFAFIIYLVMQLHECKTKLDERETSMRLVSAAFIEYDK